MMNDTMNDTIDERAASGWHGTRPAPRRLQFASPGHTPARGNATSACRSATGRAGRRSADPAHHLPAAMPDRPDPGVGTADPISPGLDTDLNLVIDVDRPSTKMSIPSMTTAAPKPDSSPWGLLIISLALDSSRISRGPHPVGTHPADGARTLCAAKTPQRA